MNEIEMLRDEFRNQDDDVNYRLKILDEFKESLKKNSHMIQTNEYRVTQNEILIKDFKNDDIFINAWNNYANVYYE